MRVLLALEDQKLATMIKTPLRKQNYVVDWVRDGEETWDCLCHPDVYTLVVVAWQLPHLSGLELCLKLRQNINHVPLLLLMPHSDMHDRVKALDHGADDCLSEPFGMEELLARIRALLRRPTQIKLPILTLNHLSLDYQRSTVFYQDIHSIHNIDHPKSVFLTAKEFQLLEYLMSYPNQVLTHEQIRDRLWGLSYEPMSNVIPSQVRSLRRKFESLGCPDRIETIRGLGYRLNA